MAGITDSGIFMFMWIGFLLLMIAGITCIFVWAIRSQQFRDQERARFLPLKSGIPEENDTTRSNGKKEADKS